MRHDQHNLIPVIGGNEQPVFQLPKRTFVAAVNKIQALAPDTEVDFDHFGHVRHLTTASPKGFFGEPFAGDPVKHARKFLRTAEMVNALGLRWVDLREGGADELPSLGWRVWFRQVIKVSDQKRSLPVRGGYVHVFVDKTGRIFMVNSTLRRGRKPAKLGKIVSRKEAIELAQAKHGTTTCDAAECLLVLSAHNGHIDPVYEVTLSSCEPRKLVMYLVKAKTGEVVYAENKLHYASAPARTFLRIPSPVKPIAEQVYDSVIESLPDPTVLKNENLTVYLGKMGREVKAKADGTFKYDPSTPEFGAVVTFFALNSQFELFKKWGLKKPEKPIPVVVRDSSVRDNAYFDPESVEIHLGVGSGLPRGLNKNIDFDLGVAWHETGHYVVFLQAPGKDLPGSEGGAGHEASGDYCDLLMDFWFRLVYGKTMGKELTAAEVASDPLIIGVYAMPPDGIRKQKNNKVTPRDKTGEVHDDGEIVGGAMADVLVGLSTRADSSLESSLTYAGQLFLASLALVPAHRVMFKDIARAFVTADQALAKGANRKLIEDSFARHGITLGSKISDPDANVGNPELPKAPRPPRVPRTPRTPRRQPRRKLA